MVSLTQKSLYIVVFVVWSRRSPEHAKNKSTKLLLIVLSQHETMHE